MGAERNKQDKHESIARKSLFFVREVRKVIIKGQALEKEWT